ncbi:MAG TPA: hypothetical protein VFO65_08875 [Acidimicrobiales bacterium]|nr:hypothetical protein [Acidimicrobiales bacterium]
MSVEDRETAMGDAKEALERDWEQTKHDLPGLDGDHLDQDVGDTVAQATGREEPPPEGVPNPPD